MVPRAVECGARRPGSHRDHLHPARDPQGPHLGVPVSRIQARRDESRVVDGQVVRARARRACRLAARARVCRQDHRAVSLELGFVLGAYFDVHVDPADAHSVL